MRISTSLVGLASAALLAACSAIDAVHTATVFNDLNSAGVISGPATSPDQIALRTGTASYTGLGVVTASDGSAATAYLGDATIRVDFNSATVSVDTTMYRAKGGLDPTTDPQAFFDMVQSDPTNFLLSMDAASGTATLSNGSVAGAGFTATTSSGNLISGSTTVVVTGGTVTGEFTGSGANGVRSSVSSVTGTVNGAAADQIGLYFAAAE